MAVQLKEELFSGFPYVVLRSNYVYDYKAGLQSRGCLTRIRWIRVFWQLSVFELQSKKLNLYLFYNCNLIEIFNYFEPFHLFFIDFFWLDPILFYFEESDPGPVRIVRPDP